MIGRGKVIRRYIETTVDGKHRSRNLALSDVYSKLITQDKQPVAEPQIGQVVEDADETHRVTAVPKENKPRQQQQQQHLRRRSVSKSSTSHPSSPDTTSAPASRSRRRPRETSTEAQNGSSEDRWPGQLEPRDYIPPDLSANVAATEEVDLTDAERRAMRKLLQRDPQITTSLQATFGGDYKAWLDFTGGDKSDIQRILGLNASMTPDLKQKIYSMIQSSIKS